MIPKKLKRNLTRALRKERGSHFHGRVVVVEIVVDIVEDVVCIVVEVEDVVVEIVVVEELVVWTKK